MQETQSGCLGRLYKQLRKEKGKVLFVPSKTGVSVSPSPMGSLVNKSCWPLWSDFVGISSPFLGPQAGKPDMRFQTFTTVQFSSVAQSCLILRPHGLQHTRPPCPSPTPGLHSDSCPLSQKIPSSHFILCCPLLLLPPIPPSIKVFSNESTLLMRWPKY